MSVRSVQPVLEMTGIVKTFPGVKALNEATLRVYPGRVMALLGENGAGKSTLMKVMTGIYSKDAGTLTYQGKETVFKGPRDSQDQGIAIIHQELNLIGELSVAENIFLGREPVGRFGHINRRKMLADTAELLQRLDMNLDPSTPVGTLSIGVQQMVEIARALSMESRVIIMDEPTDALTDTETESLFKVIRQLREEGRGIVYISHRLKEIFEICDDVTVLRDGEFVCEAPVRDLTEDMIIEKMVGRSITDQFPRLVCDAGDWVLEVESLSGPGLDDVHFGVRAGEVLGISGLMGAGRTELMRTLFGARPHTEGVIRVAGEAVSIRCPADALAHGIVYVSEDRKGDGLVLDLPVRENMTLSSLAQFTRRSRRLDLNAEMASVSDYIRSFNIKTPSSSQLIRNLSGGNQQKVAIAKGLLNNPRVLILDEPTRGVDVGARKEIYQLINEFKRKGMSIIVVSSDLPEVLGISDRILVMHNGQMTGEFDHHDADQEKLMQCAVGRRTQAL